MKSASVPWSAGSSIGTETGARAGERPFDAAGFRAFYERTARPLWAYVSRAAGDPELADDLVQEAYYRLLRADFVPESDAHAKNYLYRIATNLMRDHFRRNRRYSAAGEVGSQGSGGPGPTAEPSSAEPGVATRKTSAPADPGRGVRLRRDLRRFLGRLSPKDRQLLWLAHVEEASHREIAERLEIQERSVRVLVFRARRRLAALLEEHDVGPEVMA